MLKNVKDITISKVFTILNLLTFDRAKYTYIGDLCSGAWTDCIYNKNRFRSGRALPTVPGPCARQRGADGYASGRACSGACRGRLEVARVQKYAHSLDSSKRW